MVSIEGKKQLCLKDIADEALLNCDSIKVVLFLKELEKKFQ